MDKKDRITPIDIEHVQFDTSFRGYNDKQVDEFLDKLTSDYEDVITENAGLKKEIEHLRQELDESHKTEEDAKKKIMAIQKESEELMRSSKQEIFELKRKKDAFMLEFKNSLNTAIDYIDKVDLKLNKTLEYSEEE